MANEFKIKKGLIVTGASGGTVVDIQGSQGQLFSVTDDLSGSIFAVSDISGIPILDVNSSGLVTVDGPFTQTGGGATILSGTLNVEGVSTLANVGYLGDGLGSVQYTFQSANDGFATIDFGDVADSNIGRLSYSHVDNSFLIRTNNTTALTLDSSQNAIFASNINLPTAKYLRFTSAASGSSGTVLFGNTTGTGGDLTFKRNSDTASMFKITGSGNAEVTGKGTSAATISSDGSSTLTTKGYVDSLITGATIYRGAWDPSGGGYGSPDLSGVTQTSGYYYICSADGTAEPNGTGTEPDTWAVGDWVIYNDVSGTGQWQKIDNSSVLSGVGTGQTVALWEGAGSVTDSETLGNAPITVSGSDTAFAGNVTVHTGAGTGSLSVGRTSDQSIKLYITDTNNSITAAQDSDGDSDHKFILNRVFAGTGANDFIIQKDGTAQFTLDTSASATFAGTVNANLGIVASGAMSSFETTLSNNDDWQNSPISILERGNVQGTQTADKYAPNLNFHWGGKFSASLWMSANGHLHYGQYGATGIPASDGTINAATFLGELGATSTINTGVTGTTQSAGNNSTLIATTAYADAAAAAVDPSGVYLPLAGGTMAASANINMNSGTLSSVDSIDFGIGQLNGVSTSNLILKSLGDITYNVDSNNNGNSSHIFQESGSELMRIRYDGNVGIDATSPNSSLQVGLGTTNQQSSVASIGTSVDGLTSVLSLVNQGGNNTNGNGVSLDFHNASNWSATGRISVIHPTATTGTATNSSMQFSTYGTVGSTTTFEPRMTIDYQGNVGIGTTSPGYKLQVNGTIAPEGNEVNNLGASTNRFNQLWAKLIYDINDGRGLNNQVLTSTGSGGIAWANASTVIGGPYLPLTAGSGSPLTGTLYIGNIGGDQKIQFQRTGGNVYSIEHDSAQLYFYNRTTTEAPLVIQNDGDVLMNAGNVGIGTSNPNNLLELYKTVDSGIGPILQLTNTQYTNADNSGSSIQFRGYTLWGPGSTNPRYSEINAINGSGSVPKRIEFKFYADTDVKTPLSILQTGNVGIGTISPRDALEVVGNIRFVEGEDHLMIKPNSNIHGADFIVGDGVATTDTPVMSLNGLYGGQVTIQTQGNTIADKTVLDVQGTQGQLFSVTDDLSGDIFSVADISGVPIMNVNSDGTSYFDGKVGIGTTSPNGKLTVADGETSGVSKTALEFIPQDTYDRNIIFSYDRAQSAYRDLDIDANDVHFNNGGTEKVRITSTGNVGIGTTSPIGMLSVVNPISNSNTWTPTNNPDLWVSNAGTSNSYYAFGVTTNSGNIFSITNAGNVGIGTTSPSARLDVNGTGTFRGNLDIYKSNAKLTVTSTGVSEQASVDIQNGTLHARWILDSDDLLRVYNQTSSFDAFAIKSSGKVGIGVTNPLVKLHVNQGNVTGTVIKASGIGAQIEIQSSTAGDAHLYMRPNTSSNKAAIFKMTAGTNYNWRWQDDASTPVVFMQLSQSNSSLSVKGDIIAYGAPSDERYKENIKPIESALDKAVKLQGVTFDWKESDSILDIKEDIGFIAQDVQKVVPELVRENEDGKLSLRYQGVTPILLEAIKELKAEIDLLKSKPCNCNNCNCSI